MTTPKILLVDDDDAFRQVYKPLLESEGWNVDEAATRDEVRAAVSKSDYDLILLDLMLPPDGSAGAGIEQLAELLEQRPQTKVVVCSGVGDKPFMVKAVRAGAFDFLTKPVDPDVLLIVAERAIARARLEHRVEGLQAARQADDPELAMIGESPGFRSAIDLARRFAASDLPVLITGENGTGKELMARYVHFASARATKPFLPVNCGALTDTLLESTLFGHVQGAFTGAGQDRAGLFVEADGGTIFLDEIGDMPANLQVKLLRTLETGDVLPVGADRPVQVDVRVVSATHQDLDAALQSGTFREDLYWRIKGAEVRLPALRERRTDIGLLASHFLNRAASLSPDGRPKRLSQSALNALESHRWPGNMRELRHAMQRATVLAGDREELTGDDFPFQAPTKAPTSLQERVEALEAREIEAALAEHHGNRTHVADALGLSRQGLLNKMKRYAIE